MSQQANKDCLGYRPSTVTLICPSTVHLTQETHGLNTILISYLLFHDDTLYFHFRSKHGRQTTHPLFAILWHKIVLKKIE